jgi:hypothetical protein
MKRKTLTAREIIFSLGLLLIFSLLIFYNQQKAQKDILSSQTPIYDIALVNSPLNALANNPVDFTWNIEAPDTETTTSTTIYYSPVSSPSALTTEDSPQAAGYSFNLTDYMDGRFFLPDTFSSSISFLKGTIFYRAYAKVGNQHLWSEEIKLEVGQ